jgi:oxygen-independent coproporphyrinogen-3 oxidase
MGGSCGDALGIYISVPFCRSKCTYCNFASGVYPASAHEPYIGRIVADLHAAPGGAARIGAEFPRRVDSVYLGGGTPTLLAPALLERLFAEMRAAFDFEPGAEITVECAPGQLAEQTLEALAAAGVNRVSMGVQSFVDEEARPTGRFHSRSIVEKDIVRLRRSGISNINVDLIAGLPGQTSASWEQSLEALISSGVPHASIYMLEVDEDSRLGREVLAGGARYGAALVPGDDAIARMYERAIERLDKAGICQYEISNFARTGFRSAHNLKYWRRRPYLGLGLDASSMLRAAPSQETEAGPLPVLRTTTTSDLKAWLAGTAAMEAEWLDAGRQHEEAWFLALRLNEGVSVMEIEREFGSELVAPALETAARLACEGLLEFDGARARLTPRGRLLSNEVFQEFLTGEPEHDRAMS